MISNREIALNMYEDEAAFDVDRQESDNHMDREMDMRWNSND